MAYGVLAAVATGDIGTAAWANQNKDNWDAICDTSGNVWKSITAHNSVIGAADINTTSTSYVDMTDMSITLTGKGGDLLVWWAVPIKTNVNTRIATVALKIDSEAEIDVASVTYDDTNWHGCAGVYKFTAGAGSHTIKMRWKCNVAAQIDAQSVRSMAVVEIRA